MAIKEKNTLLTNLYNKALFPNILVVLGGTVNVFFDGILVGQRLGDLGLDAVTQSLPFYLVLCTIGSLIASGSVALSAIAAGDDNLKEGQRIYSVGLFLSIVSSVVICALAYIFLEPICLAVSTASTYSYVYDYLRITILFGVCKVLLYNFIFYLRLEGKLKRSSFAMLLMTAMNIVLDYIFLFVTNWGIYGASIASGIATLTACILCFIFLYTDKSNFKLLPALPRKGDIKMISVQGSSMAINNITSSLRVFLFNAIFKMVGVESLVVIFAIISNLNEFSICVQNGVPQTGMAMIGILYGGKEFKSLKNLVHAETNSGIILSLVVALAFALGANYIPSIFGSDIVCNFAIYCFAASLLFATINSILAYYYSSILKINIANIVTVLRGLILPVAVLFMLKDYTETLWMLYPISEILCLIIIILLTSFVKKSNLSSIYLLDEQFEKDGKIYTSLVDANSEAVSSAAQGVNSFCEEHELSSKKAMAVSLSIEEILMIIAEKSLNFNGKMDLRVFKSGDDIILRVRSTGKYYNPFVSNDESLDYLGVTMIQKMATKIDYQSTLGINTLIIYL